MRTQKLILIAAAAGALALAGCESTNEQQGQVIGAIAGGLLGSQVDNGRARTAATIAGTIAGGFIGGNIGRRMDDGDRYRASQALERSPTYQSSSWENPDTGNRYSVTPTRTYYSDTQPCRDYTTEAWIDGRRETLYGTACRQSDGSWRAAN